MGRAASRPDLRNYSSLRAGTRASNNTSLFSSFIHVLHFGIFIVIINKYAVKMVGFEFKLLHFQWGNVSNQLNSPCLVALLKQAAALSN